MPADVACPSCLRALRVREEHLGGSVKCPVCGAVFVATTSAEKPVTADPGARPRRRRARRRKRPDPVDAKLRPVAVCMIALGGIVALFHLLSFVMLLLGMDPEMPKELDALRSPYRALLVCSTCFPLLGSAVVIVAGVKMLQREHYQVAFTGCILAMIPCTSGLGFIAGIPLGIWGLMVLRTPAVAASFKVEGEEENLAEWPAED